MTFVIAPNAGPNAAYTRLPKVQAAEIAALTWRRPEHPLESPAMMPSALIDVQSDGSFSVSSPVACIMGLTVRGNTQALAISTWLHLPQRGSAAKFMRLIILPTIPF